MRPYLKKIEAQIYAIVKFSGVPEGVFVQATMWRIYLPFSFEFFCENSRK